MQKITAKKSLGQNFLINRGILEKIVNAADVKSNDIVIEIGPGTGTLTAELSKRASKVVAIEKDHRLTRDLGEKFKNSNVAIIEGDVLKLDLNDLIEDYEYKIVANIPYYITSRLLRIIFSEWPTPKIIVLMIQKEMAQRIMSRSGKENLLSLSIKIYSDPEIVGYVSRGSFRPIPKVDSAIIKLNPRTKNLGRSEKNEKLLEFIKLGFGSKRKKLSNNLSKKFGMESLNNAFDKLQLDQNIRAESLSLKDWHDLYIELFAKSETK